MPAPDHITSADNNEARLVREAHLDHVLGFAKQMDLASKSKARSKGYSRSYYVANRERLIADQKAYHERNPHKRRETTLRRAYGMTVDQFDSAMAAQDHRCLICKTQFGLGRQLEPNVDHCHATGKIRGILCRGCNQGLGLFCDNPKILRAAIRYLKANADAGTVDPADTIVKSTSDEA